jgi:organic radical activating enzyme
MVTKVLNFINLFARLYWKTLFINKKKGHALSRGADIVLVLTTKCNLHCDYCPMFLDNDKYPKFDECSIDEWKTFIENFPEWLSQIYISGGEPSLIPWVSEFINWLTGRGHHVVLLTNLFKPETFLGIKEHWRFVCLSTLHKGNKYKSKFYDAADELNYRFRLIIQELGKTTSSWSKKKEFYTDDFWYIKDKHYHAMPDAPRTNTIYLGCVAGYKRGAQQENINDL